MPEDKDASFVKTFEEAAKQLKGQTNFVVSGIYEGLQARLAEFAIVDEPKLPAIRLIDFSTPKGQKYELMNVNVRNLTVDDVKNFLSEFTSGALLP